MTKKRILMLLLTALLLSSIGCSKLDSDMEAIDDDSVVSEVDTIKEGVFEEHELENDDTGGSEVNDDEAVDFLSELTDEDAREIDQLVEVFIKYATTLDVSSQIDLFAIEDYVNGYDVEVIAERMGVDTSYEGLENPSIESRMWDVDSMITRFLFGFIMSEEGIKEKIENNTLTNQEVIEAISNTDYSALSIKRMDNPTEKMRGKENLEKLNAMYSADYGYENSDYRITLLELNGETFYCGFTLYKYNGIWTIFSLNCGGLVPVSPLVVTIPISEEDYEETLGFLDHSE